MAPLINSFALALLTVQSIFNPDIPCEKITKPLVLDGNYSSIMGKWIMVESVSEGMVGMVLQTMESHWMEISPGTKNDTVLLRQAISIEKECTLRDPQEFPLQKSAVYDPVSDGIIQNYLLPSCSNCLTGYFRLDNEDYPTRVLLLFSKERTVSKRTRKLYRKQVKCMGFHDPYFTVYDAESELCPVEE
ncbi:uncharacterized protein LOC128611931 [Ictalurus furcatus]|uniref:uncharacterized protein LOC128611931 n=1 Tax=Ictalurus furcatus TaxID=66913 RepID=UPI002350EEDC|nr:uncharacterized protein LOC128611931 [Ictalurus furcatus]